MTGELLNTGYAALQEEGDKYIARGMALGAGDVTQGGSGKATYWPPEVVEEAAEGLAGQPLATATDHTADGPQHQTPPEAIVGEVRWSDFGEVDGKAGVLYETEVDDPDIARNIENGRIEVSPLVFRDVVSSDEYDGDVPDEADYVATDIKKWRTWRRFDRVQAHRTTLSLVKRPLCPLRLCMRQLSPCRENRLETNRRNPAWMVRRAMTGKTAVLPRVLRPLMRIQ